MQSTSRGRAGRAGSIFTTIINWNKLFNGQSRRPDLEAMVASGLFEECASGVASFAVAGVDGLGNVQHGALICALSVLQSCRQHPGAEARIRRLAPALKWCLEHDLDWLEQLGTTTGSYAAQICEFLAAHCPATVQLPEGILNMCVFAGCGVFGRDEGDSEFSFTQQQVDVLVEKWFHVVRAVGMRNISKPTSSTIMVAELCISDKNKPLLLANSGFLLYVVDALLLVRARL